MKKWHELVATCCYIGYLPRIPGTLGSLAGLLIVGICAYFQMSASVYLLLILGLFWVGLVSSGAVAKVKNQTDPQIVVIDEVVGVMISVIGFLRLDAAILLLAFIFFRVFDIWKPFPIRKLETLPGGWGIMVDDLAAGVYAHLCLRILKFLTA